MKKNPKLEKLRKSITKDVVIYVDKSFEIADRIHYLLKKQGKGQRDLAEMLGKNESEISKWMTGSHNFTLKTISLIESVLGEEVFCIAGKEKVKENTKYIYIYMNQMQAQITTTHRPQKVNLTGDFDGHINKIMGAKYYTSETI